MTQTVDTLADLTGQESGVVIYGNEAIICNWTSTPGMPKVGPFGGIIGWPTEIEESEGKSVDASEVVSLLDGVNIIYDANGDEAELRNGDVAATVYHVGDAIVIAPEGWN